MTRDERLYRRLLRLYPRAFRADYEDEMVRLFLDQLRDARATARPLGAIGLWLGSIGDVVSNAFAERLRREETVVAKPVDSGAVSLAIASRSNRWARVGYLLASLPFIILAILNIAVAGFMEPVYLNPPAILGLPVGILLMLFAALWAALAFVVVRAARSGGGVAVAFVIFSIPAIVAIVFIPSVLTIVVNLTT